MEKYIDLTQPIIDKMPHHPYDDDMHLNHDKLLNKDGYTNYTLQIGTHFGTHIDLPMHLTSDSRYVCDFPIDKFIGRGKVIDVRGLTTIEYLPFYDDLISKEDIVLFYTGFDELYGKDKYYNNHPCITENLAQFLVRKEIKILGMDTPSPDYYPFNVHKLLLNNDIFILENLRNLSLLMDKDYFKIHSVPLNIYSDASPLRAYCIY